MEVQSLLGPVSPPALTWDTLVLENRRLSFTAVSMHRGCSAADQRVGTSGTRFVKDDDRLTDTVTHRLNVSCSGFDGTTSTAEC